MPKEFIYETAITIDHETNEMRVDTTREGVASQLRRSKFRETTREDSRPYRRFVGQADQLRFRRTKADRPVRAGKGFLRNLDPTKSQNSDVPQK